MKSVAAVPVLLSLFLPVMSLSAIQVDPAKGDDQNDGVQAPVKTIARGIKLAQPGDTVHLTPGTYHEGVDLSLKRGMPDKPITVDGHGAVIEGSEPIQAAEWEDLGQGLYRKVKLMPRMDAAMIGRWFFLWDGRMNLMGRTSKASGALLKKVEELRPDEWTYIKEEEAFYIKLPEGKTLAAANIRYPLRANAVTLAGKGAHLVVKNITGTHVYNDGFNIHGEQVDTVFENITAIDCGDDGFSAHENAECRIDGFTSIGNSTGLCDTVSSVTHYKNVFISRCLAYDIFFIGDSPHSMENVLVESSAVYPLVISQHVDRTQSDLSRVILKNVLIRRVGDKPGEVRVNRNSLLEVFQCTFTDLNCLIAPGGEISLSRSVINGSQKRPDVNVFQDAVWRGGLNRYDLNSLRKGPVFYKPETFGDFQTAMKSEEGSVWKAGAEGDAGEGIGADAAALEKLRR